MGIAAGSIAAIAEKKITNVLPKAFGVRLVDTDKPGWESDVEAAAYVEHVVHADDPLPSGPHRLEVFTIFPDQIAVDVTLYEQAGQVESSELSANKAIDRGAGMISGLPPLPKGSPVDLDMTVSDEGLLTVHAVERSTGKDLVIEVRISVLSKEDVDQAKQALSGLAVRG